MYEARKFNIPELKGISSKTIEEHLKLYEGYVKHTNLIHEIVENKDNPEYARRETYRRLSFEFNGMRNHEYYFEQLEGGAKELDPESAFAKKFTQRTGSLEARMEIFKNLATTRGVGWAVLYYDKTNDKLIQTWVDEQHFGQLNGLEFIFGLDMWEHSYMLDYPPSEKMKYFDAYMDNVNWEVVEKRFENATS